MIDSYGQRLLTPRDAERILKVSPSTIYSYIRTGKLPSVQVCGKQYICEETLKDYITTKPQLSSIYKELRQVRQHINTCLKQVAKHNPSIAEEEYSDRYYVNHKEMFRGSFLGKRLYVRNSNGEEILLTCINSITFNKYALILSVVDGYNHYLTYPDATRLAREKVLEKEDFNAKTTVRYELRDY